MGSDGCMRGVFSTCILPPTEPAKHTGYPVPTNQPKERPNTQCRSCTPPSQRNHTPSDQIRNQLLKTTPTIASERPTIPEFFVHPHCEERATSTRTTQQLRTDRSDNYPPTGEHTEHCQPNAEAHSSKGSRRMTNATTDNTLASTDRRAGTM